MFERFSDRARKVMALANQEAQRLNHEYIGTEHFLLGFIKEGSGVGATALKNLDIDLEKLRLDIEKILQPRPKIITKGKLPQTPVAKKVIEYAVDYARSLNHNYVGTEHLLYGLIAEKGGVASQVLMNNDLDEGKIKKGLEDFLGVSPQSEEVQEIQKPVDYWMIPRENMNLVTFLQTHEYKVVEGPTNYFNISKVEDSSDIKVGKLDFNRDGYIRVIYDLDNVKQMKYALDLRDIFDKNMVEYEEEPPSAEVLKKLKKPIKDIASLIQRLE